MYMCSLDFYVVSSKFSHKMSRGRPSVRPSVTPSIHSFILPSVRLLIFLNCMSPIYRADYFETTKDVARHGSAQALRLRFFSLLII